jgi:hypothetical protein
MLNLYPELLVKTLAVWYRAGNSEGGFWFLSEMEWSGKRKAEPGFAESARKSRLSREVFVGEPQLRR